MTLLGVIFDMDGVLCDSEPFILEAAQTHLRAKYGIQVPAADFKEFVGAGDDAFVGGPARKHGVTPELPADKEATYDRYDELIRGRLQALPGAIAFARSLRGVGRRAAVASAADLRKVRGNLQAIGLWEGVFDAIVTGSDVSRKKPAPDGFLMAASRIGIPAEQCLVIEDAVNGVKAAKAAGATCLAVTTTFPAEALRAAGADHLAPDLSAVPAVLLHWLGLG